MEKQERLKIRTVVSIETPDRDYGKKATVSVERTESVTVDTTDSMDARSALASRVYATHDAAEKELDLLVQERAAQVPPDTTPEEEAAAIEGGGLRSVS